jgi:hypothetical protein
MNLKKNIVTILFLFTILNQPDIQARVLVQHPLKKQAEQIIASLCLKFKMINDINVKCLPDERMDNAAMQYFGRIRSVVIHDAIEKHHPLSMIYMTLLHEFRHCIQDRHEMLKMRTGKAKLATFYDPCVLQEADKRKDVLWFPDDSITILFSDYMPTNKEEKEYVKMMKRLHQKKRYDQMFKPMELDADLFSIKQVKCPVCYDITMCFCGNNDISEEGYAGLDFRKKYRLEKQQNPCCKAHRFKNDKKHQKALDTLNGMLRFADSSECLAQPEYAQELRDADEKCGPLSDRHTR